MPLPLQSSNTPLIHSQRVHRQDSPSTTSLPRKPSSRTWHPARASKLSMMHSFLQQVDYCRHQLFRRLTQILSIMKHPAFIFPSLRPLFILESPARDSETNGAIWGRVSWWLKTRLFLQPTSYYHHQVFQNTKTTVDGKRTEDKIVSWEGIG